jgi:beta-galactosidase/beta-glucuronidase
LATVSGLSTILHIPLSEKYLWEAGKGNLYDLEITVTKDGVIKDKVKSYFGLRSVSLSEKALLLNGKRVFGRWVLDQGFYPDGIYTAPNDEALKNDILYSMQLGFNGARLHQKVFEPRYLYWADKLGYLVWGEYGNWGLNVTEPDRLSISCPNGWKRSSGISAIPRLSAGVRSTKPGISRAGRRATA